MGPGRWRHMSCLDIDLDIVWIRYRGPKYVIVRAIYVNRNWKDGNYIIHTEKALKINTKDFWKWRQI